MFNGRRLDLTNLPLISVIVSHVSMIAGEAMTLILVPRKLASSCAGHPKIASGAYFADPVASWEVTRDCCMILASRAA